MLNKILQICLLLLSAGLADVVVFLTTGNTLAGMLTFFGVALFGAFLKSISGGK